MTPPPALAAQVEAARREALEWAWASPPGSPEECKGQGEELDAFVERGLLSLASAEGGKNT